MTSIGIGEMRGMAVPQLLDKTGSQQGCTAGLRRSGEWAWASSHHSPISTHHAHRLSSAGNETLISLSPTHLIFQPLKINMSNDIQTHPFPKSTPHFERSKYHTHFFFVDHAASSVFGIDLCISIWKL
jgi:hypothetical protein